MTDRYVSTGGLPIAARVQKLVRTAYERFVGVTDGVVSDVYPALQRADADAFGICVAAADGRLFEAGDARRTFTIMSVAKPFAFACAGRSAAQRGRSGRTTRRGRLAAEFLARQLGLDLLASDVVT